MKDHEIRELVNQLRDVAIKYHGAGQLREKIARTVRAAILQAQSDDDGGLTDDERIMAIEGIIKPISDCDTPVYPDAEKRIADAVELLKKAAPGMLAGKSGPDGPLAGRMKSPAIPDGYVMVPKEPTQAMCAAFNDSDYGRKSLRERYVAMLAAAQQPQDEPQNIPEIIPGWIPVSERMPEDRISVILWDAEIGEVTSGHYSHKTQTFYHCGDAIENEITHWMPPPCAPQEVKGEHQIRDEMDMGARITSHRFKV